MTHALLRVTAPLLALLVAAGCEGNYAPDEDYVPPAPNAGRERGRDPSDTLFGEEGLTLNRLTSGELFDLGEDARDGNMPVNRYLWQGALDTLDFMPLASTDPFTGVIATEWATTPENPRERFKVTAYVTSHELEASSLRVAVFREALTEDGLWVPRPVSAETVTRLEDAILTRSRQIRIAAIEQERAG
jgi:hypothetical protein